MDNEELSRFCEHIGRRRKAAGLTQRQLAEAARVSVGVVRDLEQGLTARPRPDSIRRLTAALSSALHGTGANNRGQTSGAGQSTAGGGILDISILGPITAARDGQSLPLGPARRRAVLGLLAASPRETVSRARLTEALWGDDPPAHSATMIHSHVSVLRRSLDPEHSPHSRHGLIVSAEQGYRLNTARCALDLIRFTERAATARGAARAGQPEDAVAAWADAVALWRGDPLGDVDLLSGHPAVLSLARLRGRAILEYAEAAARLDQYGDSLPHLEWLAEREQLNERAWACLMIALAATGYHASALDAFGRVRRRLREELGMLPGAELAAAHMQVLRQQASGPLRPGPLAITSRPASASKASPARAASTCSPCWPNAPGQQSAPAAGSEPATTAW
jgi:DNA-binding SARP family transcriptional activator